MNTTKKLSAPAVAIACFVLAIIIAAIASTRPLHGSEFPAARAFDTVAKTWTIPTLTTNATNVSIFVEANNSHTFQTVCTGTNAIYVVHDRSLDGSNWIPFGTNNLEASTTAETTVSGKWSYFRTRFYGTNSAASVLYLGGR